VPYCVIMRSASLWESCFNQKAEDHGADTGMTTSLSLSVLPEARSVGVVRRRLSAHFSMLTRADLDDAVLAVSELITNAVLHGDGPVEVRVSHRPGLLRVEVTDDGRAVPLPRHAGLGDERGRGLHIVDAVTSRWGVAPKRSGRGKTVWFEVRETVALGRSSNRRR
jgi:anti-sigma regulatory factor (Ser/Thr protein kinase)